MSSTRWLLVSSMSWNSTVVSNCNSDWSQCAWASSCFLSTYTVYVYYTCHGEINSGVDNVLLFLIFYFIIMLFIPSLLTGKPFLPLFLEFFSILASLPWDLAILHYTLNMPIYRVFTVKKGILIFGPKKFCVVLKNVGLSTIKYFKVQYTVA